MPVNINLLPDEVIARGVAVPDTSKLFDNYFQGSDQAQKQQLQNLFAGGIPRNPDGSLDYPKAAEMVLQAQGAAGLVPAMAASKFGLLSNYYKNPSQVPDNPGVPPQSDQRSENMPVSLARPSLAQVEEPSGERLRPGQPGNVGEITGIQRGPIEGNPNLFTGFAPQPAAPEPFDQRFPDTSGGGIPTQATPVQYRPGAPTPSSPTSDMGVVPGQSSTSGGLEISEQNARRFEKAASDLFKRAEAAAALDPAMGAADRARAQFYAEQAKIIRQGLIERSALTPEQKAARDAGVGTLEYDRRKKFGEIDAKTFADELGGIQRGAENGIRGLPKAALGKQLTQQPGFYSGPWNEYNTAYQQFRNLFGTPGAALPSEAFNKVTNDLLQEQIKSMGQSGVGRVLQSEVAIMRQAIASMGITDVSNRALLEMVMRTYRKAAELGEITRDLPPDSRQLNKVVQDYLRKKPMFSEAELRDPRLLGSKEPPPESARWNKGQMLQWAAQNGLKPGDPIMFNGQLGQIPLQAQ